MHIRLERNPQGLRSGCGSRHVHGLVQADDQSVSAGDPHTDIDGVR